MQQRLEAALAANTPESDVDHVVIALPSYSVGESLLSHYAPRVPSLEHRYLHAQLLVNRIRSCEFIFLCCEAPGDEVLEYYRSLVGPRIGTLLKDRYRQLVVPDRGSRSLAAKLLDRPDLLDELRLMIGERPAMIEPWNVTEHEVEIAVRLGVPINGTSPTLRHVAFKSAGRRLFARAGVPVPVGCEDVCDVDGVAAAVGEIRLVRPNAPGVVIKHDDSGAGDGNAVVSLHDNGGASLDDEAVKSAVAALPEWYLADLCAGGVVEELIVGDRFASPSVQLDLRPDGSVVVLATHDQILGGPSAQVYLGCRFPADTEYAAELACHGTAVGDQLALLGVLGRCSVDFAAARRPTGDWAVYALEINLRKGGTTHPFAALRNLVPGRYDAERGRWVCRGDGSARAYRATDNVVDAAWTGREPRSIIAAIADAGLQFDPERGEGVVLHMLSCLAVDGRFGMTAISRSRQHADEIYDAAISAASR